MAQGESTLSETDTVISPVWVAVLTYQFRIISHFENTSRAFFLEKDACSKRKQFMETLEAPLL